MAGALGSDRPLWDEPTEADVQCVREQLQRNVKDILGVAVRCRYGRPQVVVNRPLLWDGKAVDALPDEELDPKRVGVFPTLFWLTCPHLNRAIGRLESRGWVDRVKREIAADPAAREQLEAAHRDTAAMRRALVAEETLQRLEEMLPGHYRVLTASGVGGIQPTRGNTSAGDASGYDALGVKCLHAHFADYLARGKNPVGRKVWGLLTGAGVDPRGDRTCFAGSSCRCPGAALAEKPSDPEALVDIGSNSVRFLIGRAEADGQVAVLHRELITTRLGSGVSEHGELTARAVEDTLEALRTFRERAAEHGAAEPRAWGTSALREARNRETFLIRAWEEAAVAVRVMSGEEEAIFSFRGALEVFRNQFAPDQPVVLADIGGGSTDIVLGSGGGSVVWTRSLPIGAVRLAQEIGNTVHAIDWQAFAGPVRAALESGTADMPSRAEWPLFGLNEDVANVVAVGGTATTLAAIDLGLDAYNPARVNGHAVTLRQLRRWLDDLASLDASARARIPGMPLQRADIIVPGLIILHELVQWLVEKGLGQPSCHISDSDLLQGVLVQVRGRQ